MFKYRFSSVALAAGLALVTGSALAADAAKPAATQPTAAKSAPTPQAATPAKPSATKSTKPTKKPKPVDINSASAEQLKTVPGVDEARAEMIIKNRPYPTRAYLVTKGVFPQDDYYKVKDHFVATPPAATGTKAKK